MTMPLCTPKAAWVATWSRAGLYPDRLRSTRSNGGERSPLSRRFRTCSRQFASCVRGLSNWNPHPQPRLTEMADRTTPRNRRPKAYKNEAFLDSADARPLRILSEYLEPLSHFRRQKIRDTIVFFGSARLTEDGPMGRYYQEARTLARLFTEWSNGLENSARRFVVCTGGGPGIMEAANRGAQDAGGKTVGLNIGL